MPSRQKVLEALRVPRNREAGALVGAVLAVALSVLLAGGGTGLHPLSASGHAGRTGGRGTDGHSVVAPAPGGGEQGSPGPGGTAAPGNPPGSRTPGAAPAAPAAAQRPGSRGGRVLVFNGEGNRLNAYDAATGESQTVIRSHADDPEHGRDINAQICFRRLGSRTFFIAGEDTLQGTPDGAPGWGWFELHGDRIGELSATQLGHLVPTYSGRIDNPENYGCGFLPDGRLVTTDVGDQLPLEDGNGQLIVWFPSGPGGGFADGVSPALDTNYCKIDTSLATAGGLWVEGNAVYVASNRPGSEGPGGVYRYDADRFPTDASCLGHGRDESLVGAGEVAKDLWLPADGAHSLTPSAIVPSGRTSEGRPTWYVSSVFSGVIAEYADLGPARVWLRNVMEPPGGLPLGQSPAGPGGTPFGMGVGPDGTLYYADLGIAGPGPVPGQGSVQAVRFGDGGAPEPPVVIEDGLDFPDGIGILALPAGAG